ncbi:unnamed protein product [Nippostrongylus brasiliensis]|uniref:Uncharacterized protein n=1 Tax=Nippostrongylus brasiliensis TaxID=27835 RepID=A0A0N4YBX2_NIPBR|nr:unnamed protein product [Nippostrongylus brasiliensis]
MTSVRIWLNQSTFAIGHGALTRARSLRLSCRRGGGGPRCCAGADRRTIDDLHERIQSSDQLEGLPGEMNRTEGSEMSRRFNGAFRLHWCNNEPLLLASGWRVHSGDQRTAKICGGRPDEHRSI